MTVEEKILEFIVEMDYLNNEHVLGILFYGSYLTGFNTNNSDIDLHIIFDDEDKDHLIRGNKIIDGTRIEYFEKPLSDIYLTIDSDYQNQNNAAVTIFGNSKIIYDKDDNLNKLQQYVMTKFKSPLPPLSDNEAKEQVSIINNRMEKLENYATSNNPYFTHLYHLTVDKIRRFYHSVMGFPRIETAKGFKLYTNEEYRKAFCIERIPEDEFISSYFEAISNKQLSNVELYQLLNSIYDFTKRNISLNKEEHRIPIKSRNIGFTSTIIKPTVIKSKTSIPVPPSTREKVLHFINSMGYLNDDNCLGVVVYGSSLTGFNTAISDIDLHVLFDDDEKELIRGCKIVDGCKIEYFEKPISDIYLSTENGYLNQNNAFFAMIGKGTIIFERDNQLSLLQQYICDRFLEPMPALSEEEKKEQVSIINNKMEKLEALALDDSPLFDHYYHLTVDKIRKFYHKSSGLSKIQTSKVYRIYTDEEYRQSMYKEAPEPEFIEMYLNLITTESTDKLEKLQMVTDFFDYTTRNINLNDEYRILIKSRNVPQDMN